MKNIDHLICSCYHHACPVHYPDDQSIVVGNRTADFVRKRNEERLNFITSQGYDVEIFWECKIQQELKQNPELKDFFKKTFIAGYITTFFSDLKIIYRSNTTTRRSQWWTNGSLQDARRSRTRLCDPVS
jgi:hypothetical protein